jgi:ribosomal protein S18 acetylase RimI-like enzyme
MSKSIPVQRLSENARGAFLTHLLALDAEDVRLRFGSPLSPDAIAAYVQRIDFDVDTMFGVYVDAFELAGAAHLAFGGDLAELGVSVLPGARGRGIGGALLARAAEHARNRYMPRLFMHFLAENAAMVRLARRAGMEIVIEAGDADAHVALPWATPMSVTSEMLADRVALFDYTLKSNVDVWRRLGVAMTAPRSK